MAVDYSFKPYNPQFSDIFLHEKKRLLESLSFTPRIEHLGSTAIKDLGGKGIIDMYLVAEPENIENAKEEVSQAGYDARPNEGNEHRYVFVRDADNQFGNKQRYHLHLCSSESEDFKNSLIFCKYLQHHQEVAKEYAKIKQRAAEEAEQSKDKYLAIKGPYIQKVMDLATSE